MSTRTTRRVHTRWQAPLEVMTPSRMSGPGAPPISLALSRNLWQSTLDLGQGSRRYGSRKYCPCPLADYVVIHTVRHVLPPCFVFQPLPRCAPDCLPFTESESCSPKKWMWFRRCVVAPYLLPKKQGTGRWDSTHFRLVELLSAEFLAQRRQGNTLRRDPFQLHAISHGVRRIPSFSSEWPRKTVRYGVVGFRHCEACRGG